MSQPVIYLDTNHISDVARSPGGMVERRILHLLQSGRSRLAMSLLHFVEFAAPAFRSVNAVRQLLRDVPIAWALSTEEVWDSEIAVACASARGAKRDPPRVYCDSSLDWSRGPSPTTGDAAQFLDALIEQPQLREDLLRVADEAARASMLKAEAALIREPQLPLRLSVAAHLEEFRSRQAEYAGDLEADDVIRVAGSDAFPSLCTFHASVGQRLLQVSQQSTRNDVFDDYHAAYAPYSAATALDRGTAARLRNAGLLARHRATARLADVPELVERVATGSSHPAPSMM